MALDPPPSDTELRDRSILETLAYPISDPILGIIADRWPGSTPECLAPRTAEGLLGAAPRRTVCSGPTLHVPIPFTSRSFEVDTLSFVRVPRVAGTIIDDWERIKSLFPERRLRKVGQSIPITAQRANTGRFFYASANDIPKVRVSRRLLLYDGGVLWADRGHSRTLFPTEGRYYLVDVATLNPNVGRHEGGAVDQLDAADRLRMQVCDILAFRSVSEAWARNVFDVLIGRDVPFAESIRPLELCTDLEHPEPKVLFEVLAPHAISLFGHYETFIGKHGPGLRFPLSRTAFVKLYCKSWGVRFEVVFLKRHWFLTWLSATLEFLSPEGLEAAFEYVMRPYLVALWTIDQRAMQSAPPCRPSFDARVRELCSLDPQGAARPQLGTQLKVLDLVTRVIRNERALRLDSLESRERCALGHAKTAGLLASFRLGNRAYVRPGDPFDVVGNRSGFLQLLRDARRRLRDQEGARAAERSRHRTAQRPGARCGRARGLELVDLSDEGWLDLAKAEIERGGKTMKTIEDRVLRDVRGDLRVELRARFRHAAAQCLNRPQEEGRVR